MVDRGDLAHGTQLVVRAGQVADDHGAFRLAEAFHDLQAGLLLDLPVDLRVQRFAGAGGMGHGAQVVLAQVLLAQHAVHGRRRAEGGDVVPGKQRQDVRRVKAVEVVHEDGRLAQPLAVDLAPAGLGPAGVGNRQVQAVRVHAVPGCRR